MYTVLAAPLASTPDSGFANLCVSQQDGIKHAICKLPAALNHFPSFFSQLLRRQHPAQLVSPATTADNKKLIVWHDHVTAKTNQKH